MSDMYPRPNRDAIADRVKAAQPAEPAPVPQPGDAARNFAANLTARMRAQGITAKELGEKSGVGNAATSFALKPGGREISLTAAEKLTAAVGGYLAAMIGPYVCGTCSGTPPKGFACLECGAEARAA